jgi:hypothetical protein
MARFLDLFLSGYGPGNRAQRLAIRELSWIVMVAAGVGIYFLWHHLAGH